MGNTDHLKLVRTCCIPVCPTTRLPYIYKRPGRPGSGRRQGVPIKKVVVYRQSPIAASIQVRYSANRSSTSRYCGRADADQNEVASMPLKPSPKYASSLELATFLRTNQLSKLKSAFNEKGFYHGLIKLGIASSIAECCASTWSTF